MKSRGLLIVVLIAFAGLSAWGQADLTASLAQIPGLADSPEEGLLVEMVKAIDDVYKEGSINIIVYPFARSVQNVASGNADFHIPGFVPSTPDLSSPEPLARVAEPLGKVKMILYSNASNPITKEDIEAALDQGGRFPYVIEAGIQEMFDFPIVISNDSEQSLRKVQAGRIDAYLWPPEADMIVRDLNLNRLHREILGEYDDPIIIANTRRGIRVSEILNEALIELKAQGRMQELHGRMHMPYEEWQPHEELK